MNTTTITDLRRLLERALLYADNEAIRRLPVEQRTVEGVAGAYLPRLTYWTIPAAPVAHGMFMATAFCHHADTLDMLRKTPLGEIATCEADLTDPGTAHALLVALTLALGLDPGEGALGVSWFPLPATDAAPWERWCLMANELYDFASIDNGYVGSMYALAVAAEPHPVRALALAVRHVLGAP